MLDKMFGNPEKQILVPPFIRDMAASTHRIARRLARTFWGPEMQTTWQPHEKHGRLTEQSDLPDSVFAFPRQRKEPLTDANHVRNAIARFDQVIGVSDEDRELAFANIRKAADHYGVHVSETNWKQLGPLILRSSNTKMSLP